MTAAGIARINRPIGRVDGGSPSRYLGGRVAVAVREEQGARTIAGGVLNSASGSRPTRTELKKTGNRGRRQDVVVLERLAHAVDERRVGHERVNLVGTERRRVPQQSPVS
jgi:hypothetical protein